MEQRNIEVVDLRFTDLFGQLQHISIPPEELNEAAFSQGVGFDGSSIRGFQEIHESDMLLHPIRGPRSWTRSPRCPRCLICDVMDPVTRRAVTPGTPGYVARKAERHLVESGRRRRVLLGPGGGVLRLRQRPVPHRRARVLLPRGLGGGHLELRSRRRAPQSRLPPPFKRGYFPVPPTDTLQTFRSEVMRTMQQVGIRVEAHHHEVATAGQGEIDLRYAPLVRQADQMQTYKYIVKNIGPAHGKTVTFMPKPLFSDNGCGMHCHQSLWKDGRPLFFDAEGYAQLSSLALNYIGGLLRAHPGAARVLRPDDQLLPAARPRLRGPGEPRLLPAQPIGGGPHPDVLREPRRPSGSSTAAPIPSANVYLAFAAMLMAGLDGIERRLDPGRPDGRSTSTRSNPTSCSPSPPLRVHWRRSWRARGGPPFLLRGDVFTEDLIRTWISYKREDEIAPCGSTRTLTSSSCTTTADVLSDRVRIRSRGSPPSCPNAAELAGSGLPVLGPKVTGEACGSHALVS